MIKYNIISKFKNFRGKIGFSILGTYKILLSNVYINPNIEEEEKKVV